MTTRPTPWGEIAFQTGSEKALAVVAKHDEQGIAPGGDVIREFLPRDRPVLILMDELMNFVNRSRKSGLASQLYSCLHNLSEEARGRDNMVLAVSIPASELEMSAEDQSDYERFKKLLDRVGKAVMMSAESETSEIIRRRLFEWDENAVTADGRVLLTREALAKRHATILATGLKIIGIRCRNNFPLMVRARPFSQHTPFTLRSCRCLSGSGRFCRDSSRRAAFCGCSLFG